MPEAPDGQRDATRHPRAHAGQCGHASAAGGGAANAPVPDGTIYTCPMHPQIRQVGPGACPICGMAL